MLRPLLASLAALSLMGLVLAPLQAAQPGGRGNGNRPTRQSPSDGPKRAPAEARKPSADTPAKAPDTGPPPGIPLDRVVAIVNDGVVTQSELDELMAKILGQLQERKVQAPPDEVLRSQALDRLVVQEVELQRADRIGLKITDEQVNDTIRNIAEKNKLTLAQMPAELAKQGVEYSAYRLDTKKEITLYALRQKEVLSKINVTPRELEQFIERMKKLPNENDEYDVSDILIAIPADANQAKLDELQKKAQEIYERSATEDFARLAIANSNSQTALEGGELGPRKGPDLPTCCAETIVAMKVGEVSKPIATANVGFHIVKLNAIRRVEGDPMQDQVHVRHILVKPNTLKDDATVQLQLAGVRQKILNGEDFAAFASSMSVDSASAVNGGEMDWRSPTEFVPEFAAAVSKLKDGEISAPFQSEYGWHIVQLLGRRRIDVTEDTLRDRAYRQLVDSKADEETELWLRHLRDDAYIELIP